MNTELPLYGQEKRDTCALACLRMVLAAHGTSVAESVIEAEARIVSGGTDIEELQRLARHFGLVAETQRATPAQLRAILAEGKLPIAYINRAFFDLASLRSVRQAIRSPLPHAVIPTRLSQHFVSFHDPGLVNVVRRSLARFDRAHHFFDYLTLVCYPTKPGEASPSFGRERPGW